MLTDFQNVCTVGKRMKFDTKPIRHYPSYLRHVATLPLKIKNANFLQIFNTYGKMLTNCIFIASSFVTYPQISIFSVFKIASFPHTDCKEIFPCHCSFTCLLLRSICCTGNYSQQMSLQCLSINNQHGIQ